MKRVTDKASRECALQPGPPKQRPNHGQRHIFNRRSGADLHKVAEGRSYFSITIRHRERANKHPLNGKEEHDDSQRRPSD